VTSNVQVTTKLPGGELPLLAAGNRETVGRVRCVVFDAQASANERRTTTKEGDVYCCKRLLGVYKFTKRSKMAGSDTRRRARHTCNAISRDRHLTSVVMSPDSRAPQSTLRLVGLSSLVAIEQGEPIKDETSG